MDLRFGLEQDVWHGLSRPGAYEWWYFDAIDERQEYSLVAIYCLGLPFSPHYREAVRSHQLGGQPAPDPRDYALLSFTLYRHGRWTAYLLNEYSAQRCETAADRPFIRIADNCAEWLPGAEFPGKAPLAGEFRLRVADTLLGGGVIEGELSFCPDSLPHCTTDGGGTNTRHTWVLAAPACRVEGDLTIQRPDGAKTVRFRGDGYHDHNYGAEDFTAAMRAWSWGRVHMPDATLVYYDVVPLDGHPPTRRLLIVDRETGQVDSPESSLTRHGWRSNPFLLASPGAIRFQGVGERASVWGEAVARTVVDPGPFYMRFLAEFDVTWKRDGKRRHHRGLGFAEYLQPARLDWRWTWPMLKTRFIRSSG